MLLCIIHAYLVRQIHWSLLQTFKVKTFSSFPIQNAHLFDTLNSLIIEFQTDFEATYHLFIHGSNIETHLRPHASAGKCNHNQQN